MDTNIILTPISLQDLIAQIRAVVREEVKAEQATQLQEKLLTATEAASFLKVSRPTLSSYTKQGIFQPHYLSGKVLYRYSELLGALDKLKRVHR